MTSARVYSGLFQTPTPRGVGLALMGLATAKLPKAILAAGADLLSERTGIVIQHAMSPVGSDHVGEIKRTMSKAQLDAFSARGRAMTVSEVLGMLSG